MIIPSAITISLILQPMATKAIDIIKDNGMAIVKYRAGKAMDTFKDKEKAVRSVVEKAMQTVVDNIEMDIQMDISSLQITLHMIERTVQEAEEKQIDYVFVRNWLSDLVDISYEARDVLDDLITFYSCIIAMEEDSNPVNFISSFMLSYVSGSSSDTSKLSLAVVLSKLAKDIENVRKRFDEKKKECATFVLKSAIKNRTEVGPFINKQRDDLFLGREEVKQEIMEKILHPSDDRVDVVVIWGMGGIGKTTLAQSIYNDERVKYVSRRWLSVGVNKFNVENVIMEIVNDRNTTGIGNLQTKLEDKFRSDRFLIVLDDVWDVGRNECNLLFNQLTEVWEGGLIIITSREKKVCPELIEIQTAYNLESLSEEDSWSLFESCAYKDGKSDNTPYLKHIGKKIVKKLNGLPLALRVVGRSLLNKDSNTWTNFLESNEWMLIDDDNEVMSTLRWSYNHLPRHLKMCFTYCSLFPKDHVLDKKLLVQMWMAHDLIQKEEHNRRPEDVGADYFEELVNVSLLQCVDGKHVMHDLIHDLALLVSNGEFASANSSLTNDQMKTVRHITITLSDYLNIPRLWKIEKLLTLYTIWGYDNYRNYSVLGDAFKQLKSIRVLVLCDEEIKKIPDSISELRHLRYLDVSKTKVKSLPESLCHLYNLQMLAAPLSAILPRNIVNMSNLRHLRASLLTCKGVGKLTSLQELSSICVCEGDNIRELEYMQLLRGKLRIKGLENVTSSEDAAGAFMEKQILMDELILEFDKEFAKPTISEEVLDALGCPPNLTYLQILGYTGVKSPSWMVDTKHKFHKLSYLKKLRIYDCLQLQSLPPDFHNLFSLKSLHIESCTQLRSLPPYFHKLSSLNSLKIKSCPQLQSLPANFHELPSLNKLHIKSCPQLQSLPPNFHKLSSLVELSIDDCPELRSLPTDFHKLSSLEILHITSYTQLQLSIPYFKKFSAIEELHIISHPQDQSLKRSINSLVTAYQLPLEERCELESSHDWHQIKHIRNLYLYAGNFITVSGGTLGHYRDEEEEILSHDDHSDDDNKEEITSQPFTIGTAASIIFTILQPMVDKVMAMVVNKVDGIANIQRNISNLQITLHMIERTVQEAEEKQIDYVFVWNWLRDLVDISYEARDVLDDFITFSSCVIKAEEASNLVNFTSSFMLSYVGDLNQLEDDIRSVSVRFDEMTKKGETLATLISVEGGGSESVRVERRSEVEHFINKQRDGLFLGREEVKEGIMEKLLHLSDDNHVDVVAIWGKGGIGKTTLAQSIYNDERVKEDEYPTKNRKWLCVGKKKFSAEKVIKEIVNDQNTTSIGNLQKKLKEKLRGVKQQIVRRFLIVLDDVWDVDDSDWDLLFNPLTEVGKGGLIIITTRKRKVCTTTNTQKTYDLEPLSKEESWSIFESCAYTNGKSDNTLDLKRIGKEIVKKLNGLPLALKVVGCSLLDKDSSTWTNFLESKLTKDDEVMSVLRGSYNHLPRHLKMCFTYCSLFPKDHVFIEKVLVQMWMAHDLIQKEERERPEDVGAEYFEELVNASLLECVNGKYVMHDLIHDLALLVSNGEFATANGSLSVDQMEEVRHITIAEDDYSEILSLRKIEKLLTLYTICSDEEDPERFNNYGEEDTNWFDDFNLSDVFNQFKSIRVLVLSSEHIKEIPNCISELKHLRYLDVRETNVESLPDSLCHLYNLQMLAAPRNAELPRDTVNMVNLRYLRAKLSTCKEVGKLTSLQELTSICVCKGDNIRELGSMQLLRGELTIEGLENVTSTEDIAGALMEKQTLMDELHLVFNKHFAESTESTISESTESTISAQVLDSLGCPPKLTYLKIYGYIGVKSPRWMVDGKLRFDKLQMLELSNCPKLESLPPLGELISLKHLSLLNVGVKRLGDEFYGKFTNSKVFFPSLESLSFGNMQEWEQWGNIIINKSNVSFFLLLTRLEIIGCAKLVSVLPVKNHTSKWKQEDKHPIMNAANFMRFLSSLKIWNCDGLKRLLLDALVSLKELMIGHCSSLVKITSSICLATTIERLQISYCKQLETMGFEGLPSLKSLDIRSCDKLISIPCLLGIKFLYITDCKSLTTLCINDRGLDSLEYLLISDCPVLELTLKEESSASSGAVRLEICTDKKQIFTKLFQGILAEFENFDETVANKSCKLRSLKSLCISRCKDLMSLPEHFYKLLSLNSLKIENFPKLQSLPLDFYKLCSLERLEIISCPKLQSLPSDFDQLSSLNSLKIVDCPQLQSLPACGFHHSMKSLELLNCPLLYERCKDESGFDWHKIMYIPKLTISGDHKVHRYGGDR